MEIIADPITVNCRKVLAGLKLIGADYTLTKVDYFKGEQKSPEIVAINPNAAIPVLRDGDLVLWESNAILQYAADQAGNASAYPTDLKTRADVNRWLLWECGTWFPTCYVHLVENCVKPLLGAETDQSVLDGEVPNFHKLAGILDCAPGRERPSSAATIRPSPTWRWRRRCTSMPGPSCRWRTTPTSGAGCRRESRRRPGGKPRMSARASRRPRQPEPADRPFRSGRNRPTIGGVRAALNYSVGDGRPIALP